MSFKELLRDTVFHSDFLRKLWTYYSSWKVNSNYRNYRERYAKIAAERGLVYREVDAIKTVQQHLKKKGYRIVQKKIGEIHTFAFFPNLGWHKHLIPDLKEFGKVTWFDYESKGYHLADFLKCDSYGLRMRREMNELVIPALKEANKIQPVDWVFVYANGVEIRRETILRIGDELGIPTVNMCLDDKNSWEHLRMDDHRGGQIDIASAFDLSWTSARVATEWYMAENARPIYLPEGFDMSGYYPMQVEKDIPVSFVGQAYGFRYFRIKDLQRLGIPVVPFGSGWNNKSYVSNINEIFNRSVINLGMGEFGYSDLITNVKGRDFEVPGAGGGVYLTSFNPDLALHFDVGREIICYRNFDEMLELIRYYLKHQDEAVEIAQKGYLRALREHRWFHRFQKILNILGILPQNETEERGI